MLFSIAEPQPFIAAFASQIFYAFEDHSFGLHAGPPYRNPCANIMSTSRLPSDRVYERSDLQFRGIHKAVIATFDATDFHAKYKDFPWTTYFPLERICLSPIGLKDIWTEERLVRTAFRDTVTVFFSGATADKSHAEHPNDVYTKA